MVHASVEISPLDKMPILEKLPEISLAATPIEQRGAEFRKFLSASVKISVNGSSGSGTIVYYDEIKNLAYIASCGHLWEKGTMSSEEGIQKKITCKVIVFYHNDEKLKSPKTYVATVIFYSYITNQDTSLLTFTPDWQPDYFPIAPINYQYKIGSNSHSLGCDSGGEVSHYNINIIGLNGSLVTNRNSPRPGRSGGGLMDDDGYYIGTCWGTQYTDGSGNGYFTPLTAIHSYWNSQARYSFLLNQQPNGGLARKLRIVDRTGQQGEYKPEYILLPNGR